MSEKDTSLGELEDMETSDDLTEQWETVRLGDVADKRTQNVDPQKVELESHVGLEHIESNNPYPDSEPIEGLSSTKRRFEPGDILFGKLRPNLEKAAQPDFEGVASSDIFPIIAKEGINSRYLLYQLSSKPSFDYARRTSVGTRMPRTSWDLFTKYEFELPPLQEQRKIASVLDTIDQLIRKNGTLEKQTKQVKQGLAREFFTKGFFQHDSHKENGWRCKSKLIPAEWEIAPAEELMGIRRGASPRPRSDKTLFGGDIPWIKIGDANLDRSQSIDTVESFVTEKGKSKSEFVEEGTLLVANSGATCGFAVFAGLDGCVHDGWLILEDYEGFDKKYLYHYINWNYEYLRSLSLGSAQTNLSTYLFGRLDIPKPPMDEQKEIANTLDSFEHQQYHFLSEREQMGRVKEGLMQDLLSGEVYTSGKDIEVTERILKYE